MKSKVVFFGVLALIVVAIGGYKVMSRRPSPPPMGDIPPVISLAPMVSSAAKQSVEISPAASVSGTMTSFTLAQLTEHVSPESCYLAIGTSVYDVTKYVSQHPGGQAILKGCGQVLNGTMKHPGGSFESDKIKEIIAAYQIGTLVTP